MIDQVLPLLVVIVVVGAVSLWYRRTNGTATATTATFAPEALRSLGVPNRQAAILLFTAPGCPPCVPAKRAVDDAGLRHGVAVVAADVTEHAAVATSQHVYRAPTTFVIDAAGRALARISGIPREEELDQLLGTVEVSAA